MSGVLHMRIRKGRKVYRFWSGAVDAYLTKECSKQQALNFMLQEAAEEAKRQAKLAFERADTYGTACRLPDTSVVLGGPWRRERCSVHDVVHHDFLDGMLRALCRRCGEPPEALTHQATKGCR
jgi:hypothetical protein